MSEKNPYLRFNAFLVQSNYFTLDIEKLIKNEGQVKSYPLLEIDNVEGMLFVKITEEIKPKWGKFAESVVGHDLDELANRSSSAVLIIKSNNYIFAFTFGYGRHLINTQYFVHDFGIKTALNMLNQDSLRSVDLFSLDDQAVQKRAQATRESSVDVFGIDISKDILRAVTGSPKKGVNLQNISGADFSLSFNLSLDISSFPELIDLLIKYYHDGSYKENFSWVDNISRVKEKTELMRLNEKLVDSIKKNLGDIVFTIPEIIKWDDVYGFSFTRSKNLITPTIQAKNYLENIDSSILDIESVKKDRLFVHDVEDKVQEYPLYQSIYYEVKDNLKTYVLFCGIWYEIDNNFISRINAVLQKINISNLAFPKIRTWKEGDVGKEKWKIESEGEYNDRIAKENLYHLLDRKLVKSSRTTTSIELCDLLTEDKHFIHVKHRKGGSAGLSHLFAQGNISAEILLGDRDFRKAARSVLRRVKKELQEIVPLDNFKSELIEIVFLILGEDPSTLISNLPFFSKVNLSKTYENLSQRGFKVSIAGADKIEIP